MAVKNILIVHIQYNHNKTERSLYQWSSYCPVKYMSHIMGCLQCPVLVQFYARGFPILWIFLFSSVSFSLYDSVRVSVFPLRLQTLLYSILRKLCWMVLPFVSLVFNFGFNRVPENSQLSLNLQIHFLSFQKHWQLMRHKIQLILQLNYELITTRHKSTQSAPH